MPGENKILTTLLDRLYGTLVHGPCLNCRVHNSRQRVDLFSLIALQHLSVKEVVPRLITDHKRIEIKGQVATYHGPEEDALMSEQNRAHRLAYEGQLRLLARLRGIAEDARDYEQETGESALYIGYPFLSLPPGNDVAGTGRPTPRVLAPLALIAVDVTVKCGAVQSVALRARGEGTDLVIPNHPLLAWLENQTGRDTADLFADETGEQPYREINDIARLVAQLLRLPAPSEFSPETPFEALPKIPDLPKHPAFLNAAALGLFPVSNQGLLRDLKAMSSGADLSGPVQFFLNAQVETPAAPADFAPATQEIPPRDFTKERLVTRADPFQALAVRQAEEHPLLVIHGPPGTGKSQTITNIIGDHLARGERILMVCDKRTAIDVVYNRLEHLGLGGLCALVHDSQRDQRPLYMKIRNHLDSLPDARLNRRVNKELEETDAALRAAHDEIIGFFTALNLPAAESGKSFHELVGEWFTIPCEVSLPPEHLADLTGQQLARHGDALRELLDRGARARFDRNPWAAAAGMTLPEFLTANLGELRERLRGLMAAAGTFDWNTAELGLPPDGDLTQHATDRKKLAAALIELESLGRRDECAAWLKPDAPDAARTLEQLNGVLPAVERIHAQPLDAELALNLAGGLPSVPELNRYITATSDYEAVANRWYSFLFFLRKSAAATALAAHGLPTTRAAASRLRLFLTGVKDRLLVRQFEQQSLGLAADEPLPPDTALVSTARHALARLRIVVVLRANPQLSLFRDEILADLAGAGLGGLVTRLNASATRARKLVEFLTALGQSALFAGDWLAAFDRRLRANGAALPEVTALSREFPTVEDVLRCRQAFAALPPALVPAAGDLLGAGLAGHEGLEALRKELLRGEIARRIQNDPVLQQAEGVHVRALLDRYAGLTATKERLSRDYIRNRWLALQKELLVDDGRKQMNAAGAGLKRRLITRGDRAMKLRQMIQYGLKGTAFEEVDEPAATQSPARARLKRRQESRATLDDPLYDVCPVWMASPATVALIFPRMPIFDVIIFDEASQCRLEEALPVLTRGRRVVIAGDPKQLPPTRFFESALAETELEEAENEQDLFEQQQADTEDLLSGALNLQVRQSYLDVHYRSRHESLIGFSNRHFYRDRLQPVPAHPATRPPTAAIRLRRVDGAYVKRRNEREAEAVVAIVRDLLGRKQPPSIGIACFNLVQRDLILQRLEDEADRDKGFGARFEAARNRAGEGSFEGLFVKNLENVQGDERDHLIISTTFGPDEQGRFRRNFGPVGRQGGGRRLNVLVTRAREMIHVVTSIPRAEYAALPEVDDQQSPGGRWLLYAYLHYAEALADQHQRETGQGSLSGGPAEPSATVLDSPHPSTLARWLGQQLAADGQSADVHWGNDGFCVDVALHHPGRPDQRTLGVLCDLHRFADAPDLADWEVFRTQLLEGKGWQFQRVFSPGLFRDWEAHRAGIRAAADQLVRTLKPPDLPENEPAAPVATRMAHPVPPEALLLPDWMLLPLLVSP